MQWDPVQYLAFGDLRLRPALELMNQITLPAPAMVVDLGCGAGNVTRLLRAKWPEARLTGIDGSEEMLQKARLELAGVEFLQADIANWQPERPVDVIFTNAALQWLDGHDRLLPELVAKLAPGGQIAIQMPRNYGEASHQAMIETVEAGPWAARLRPLIRARPVRLPAAYYELMQPHCRRVDIWETVYLQQLEGQNAVTEWTKGSALRPFLNALEGAEREAFEAAYSERVNAAYPPASDGRTLFPFRRLFIVAER